jgi:hypothetical protein
MQEGSQFPIVDHLNKKNCQMCGAFIFNHDEIASDKESSEQIKVPY